MPLFSSFLLYLNANCFLPENWARDDMAVSPPSKLTLYIPFHFFLLSFTTIFTYFYTGQRKCLKNATPPLPPLEDDHDPMHLTMTHQCPHQLSQTQRGENARLTTMVTVTP